MAKNGEMIPEHSLLDNWERSVRDFIKRKKTVKQIEDRRGLKTCLDERGKLLRVPVISTLITSIETELHCTN